MLQQSCFIEVAIVVWGFASVVGQRPLAYSAESMVTRRLLPAQPVRGQGRQSRAIPLPSDACARFTVVVTDLGFLWYGPASSVVEKGRC